MKRYRKHIRLKGFDYSESLYYFVTICTQDRQNIFKVRVSKRFGHTLDVAATHASPDINASESKRITDVAERCLLDIPEHFPNAEIDFYVFMPDHLHLILAINNPPRSDLRGGAACRAATKRSTLGTIIGSFKSAASRLTSKKFWQPNYYEHIIRSEANLTRIRNYLLQNPHTEHDEINWKHLDPSV